MDGALDHHQGHPDQYQDDNDLSLPEEDFDPHEGSVAQCDDDLLLADDEFDPQQSTLAESHDNLNVPEHCFDAMIPCYLPDNALVTESVRLVNANGQDERYLTMRHTPLDNYIARKINDGHEFAIGGDPSHILNSLMLEFQPQLQQRWHVIVVPENNLRLANAPRRSYPLFPGIAVQGFQNSFEGIQPQKTAENDDDLMSGGHVSLSSQSNSTQGFSPQAHSSFNGLQSAPEGSQVQQRAENDDNLMSSGPVSLSDQINGVEGLRYQADSGFDNSQSASEGSQTQHNVGYNDDPMIGGTVDLPEESNGFEGFNAQAQSGFSRLDQSLQQDDANNLFGDALMNDAPRVILNHGNEHVDSLFGDTLMNNDQPVLLDHEAVDFDEFFDPDRYEKDWNLNNNTMQDSPSSPSDQGHGNPPSMDQPAHNFDLIAVAPSPIEPAQSDLPQEPHSAEY